MEESLPPPLRGLRPCVATTLFTDLLPRVASSMFTSDSHKLRELCVASRDAFDRDVATSLRLVDAVDRTAAEVAHTTRAIINRGCCPQRVHINLQHGDMEKRQQRLLDLLHTLQSCKRPGAKATDCLSISGAMLGNADVAAAAAAAWAGVTRLELWDCDAATCRSLGAALLPLLSKPTDDSSAANGIGSKAREDLLAGLGTWRCLASLDLRVQGPRPLAAPLFSALSAAANLRSLTLTTKDLPLTRSDARQLGRLTQLQSLTLDDVMARDVVPLALQPLTRLTSLTLAYSGDAAGSHSQALPAAAFSALAQLVQLHMPDHALELPRQGELSLAALTALTSLHVAKLARARNDHGGVGFHDDDGEDDDDGNSDGEEEEEEEEVEDGGAARRLRAVPVVFWPQQLRELELHDDILQADALAGLSCIPHSLERVAVRGCSSCAGVPYLEVQVPEARFADRGGSLLPAGAWTLAIAMSVLAHKLQCRCDGPWGSAGPCVPLAGLVLDVVPRRRRDVAAEEEQEEEQQDEEEQEDEEEEEEEEEEEGGEEGAEEGGEEHEEQQEGGQPQAQEQGQEPGQGQGQQDQAQQPQQPQGQHQAGIGQGGEGAGAGAAALPAAPWPRALLPPHLAMGVGADAVSFEAAMADTVVAIQNGVTPPPPCIDGGHGWLLMLGKANLQRLMLGGFALSDRDLRHLAQGMTQLQHLSLAHTCSYDPVSLLTLGSMPALTHIELHIDYWCYGPGGDHGSLGTHGDGAAGGAGVQPAVSDHGATGLVACRRRVAEQYAYGPLDRTGGDTTALDRLLQEAWLMCTFWSETHARLTTAAAGAAGAAGAAAGGSSPDLAPPERCGHLDGRWTAAQADLILSLVVVASTGRRKQPQLRKVEVHSVAGCRLHSRPEDGGAQDAAARRWQRGEVVGRALVATVEKLLAPVGAVDNRLVRVCM